jgi:hypothetical protein
VQIPSRDSPLPPPISARGPVNHPCSHTHTTDTRPNASDELVQRGPETTFPNPNPARFSQLPIDPWEENIDAVDD